MGVYFSFYARKFSKCIYLQHRRPNFWADEKVINDHRPIQFGSGWLSSIRAVNIFGMHGIK